MTKARLLVVDDDAEMRSMLVDFLSGEGHAVRAADGAESALVDVAREPVDLVITDLRMGGLDGLELTRRLSESSPAPLIIMMTAFGSIEVAIEAMRAGAFNFITKPFKMASLKVLVDKALEERRMREENSRLRREVIERYAFQNIVGKSPEMQKIFDIIERVAATDSNVLITGESGTGKELVARAIHYGGHRKTQPFVAVNCSSLSENLLESELFGHVRGAFTGAVVAKKGLIEAADGGTLFLDEIGDMNTALQAKLLRVLEDKEVRPIGAVATHKVDVRVVAATNRNLARAVERNDFREDLFFRLNVIGIRMPPLRERKNDIPLLAEHFVRKIATKIGREILSIDRDAVAFLVERPWRGNVRELENALERAIVLCLGNTVTLKDLKHLESDELRARSAEQFFEGRPTLEELEDRYIDLVLRESGGDKNKAAQTLGVSTRTLYRRESKPPDGA